MTDLTDEAYQLFLAISFGKIHKVDAYLKQLDDINTKNGLGRTLLVHTVCCGPESLCSYVVRLLLFLEVNINLQDMFGRTALMYACADLEKDDLVRQLMRCKLCNPNVKDKQGNTALIYAVAYRSKLAVAYLLDDSRTCYKLNLQERNSRGETAEDIAISMKLKDILIMFRKKAEVILDDGEAIQSTSGTT